MEPAGGLFWFTDLCQPALNLAAASAPLGSIGVVLPAGVALAMFANIQRSFGVNPSAQGGAKALCPPPLPLLPPSLMLLAQIIKRLSLIVIFS